MSAWGDGYEWTENFTRHCEEQERIEAMQHGDHAVLSLTRTHDHIDDQYCRDPGGYIGRHRYVFPLNGMVVWNDGRFAAITSAGPYRKVG